MIGVEAGNSLRKWLAEAWHGPDRRNPA